MSRKRTYTLKRNDKKAAQILMKLGMPENLAKTLMYLSHIDECQSTDIQKATNLKQPQVSIVMQELRRKKWIKERILEAKGKGRPRYSYRIIRDLSDIMKDFEQDKLKEIDDIKNDISKVKNLIAG